MKLAVSNIAWPNEANDEMTEMLRAHGVQGIEAAPTKFCPDLATATPESIAQTRDEWIGRQLPIIATQALLFGKPELVMFEDRDTRLRAIEYLRYVIRLSSELGAKAQVFGSPKNRKRGSMTEAEAWPIAVKFFRELGRTAVDHETALVIEANPPEYGADFLTHARDALRLVQDVDHPGVGLHLDTACMLMAGDNPEEIIPRSAPFLRHFHVSQPSLSAVGASDFPHERFASALAKIPYDGWVSIEMRTPEPFSVAVIERAVTTVQNVYGPALDRGTPPSESGR